MLLLQKSESNDELEASWRRNFVEWGQPQLTLDAYISREQQLASTDFAKNSRDTWFLIDQTLVVGQLETYKREANVVVNNDITKVTCHSIASVFVPVEHRGRGYGKTLIRMLKEHLIQKCHNAILVSNLYSDIGPQFYAQEGWLVHSPRELDIQLPQNLDCVDNFRVIPITRKMLPDVVKYANTKMHLKSIQDSQTSIYLTLTQDCIEWFRKRSCIYAYSLHEISEQTMDELAPFGYCTLDRSGAVESYILMFYDFKEKYIMSLSHLMKDVEAIRSLVMAACNHPFKSECFNKLTIWNPADNEKNEQFWTHSLSALSYLWIDRDKDSLPSLFVHDIKSNQPIKNVQWYGNHKFCWV